MAAIGTDGCTLASVIYPSWYPSFLPAPSPPSGPPPRRGTKNDGCTDGCLTDKTVHPSGTIGLIYHSSGQGLTDRRMFSKKLEICKKHTEERRFIRIWKKVQNIRQSVIPPQQKKQRDRGGAR